MSLPYSDLIRRVGLGFVTRCIPPHPEPVEGCPSCEAKAAFRRLEEQLSFEQKMHVLYRGQVDEFTARILELEEQYEILKSSEAQAWNKAQREIDERQRWAAETHRLEEQLEAERGRADAQAELTARLTQRVRSAEEQLDTYRHAVDYAHSAEDEAKARIKELEEQYESALATIETLESKEELSSIIRAQTEEIEGLQEQFETLRKVADGLFQMIDRETWRATGGDDQQGHYEGDYRAAQMEEYLVSLRPSNPASSPPFVSESASAYDKTMDAIDAMNRRKASNQDSNPAMCRHAHTRERPKYAVDDPPGHYICMDCGDTFPLIGDTDEWKPRAIPNQEKNP